MADARQVEKRGRYVSFNLIDDYQGRVENIEESFNNLPHRLYIPLQWMNNSISKVDRKELMQRKGIDSLNDTMLHFYQVN